MMKQLMLASLLASLSATAWAQAQTQPTYTLVETKKKSYGRASLDFRNVGKVDFWFVGHDRSDGPFMALDAGGYAKKTAFNLPENAVDGTNGDRHQCAFLHLDGDALVDMVCALGADKGLGSGPNEVYRNTSTKKQLGMSRIEGAGLPTGIEDATARSRIMTPFRFADGSQGIWSVAMGGIRPDGQPNINRLFRYNGAGSFKFTEVPSAPINVPTFHSCGRAGDLNGDGLDDLLLCRLKQADGVPAGSILYLQAADGSFRESPLPMAWTGFADAEIADLNGDGRQDLVVSVEQVTSQRVEVYLQTAAGTLPSLPNASFRVSTRANSLAVGDLDGDGRPDIYVALADGQACLSGYKKNRSMSDLWPDVVLSSLGMPVGTFREVAMTNEPRTGGCSWLATWASPGVIHLSRGTEGAPGNSYALQFRAARGQQTP